MRGNAIAGSGVVLVTAVLLAAGCGRHQPVDSLAAIEAEAAGLRETIAELQRQIEIRSECCEWLARALAVMTAPPPRLDSPEALLEHQPRMETYRRTAVLYFSSVPGTSPWRPARLEIPPEFTARGAAAGGWDTPGALLAGLVEAAGLAAWLGSEGTYELTLRALVTGEDEATGMIMLWGFADDAVAGMDYRLRLRRESGTWFVVEAEERYHARRGLTEDGLPI